MLLFRRLFQRQTWQGLMGGNGSEMPPRTPNPMTSSPLSSLASPESFFTPGPADVTVTDISSPAGAGAEAEAEDDATLSSGSRSPNFRYHEGEKVPLDLRDHCRVYFEENLHEVALNLLNSLFASQRSPDCSFCPPPSQLSLLCTVIIHPDFTTRPKEPHWPEIAADALVYLRSVLSLFGPIEGRFKEATCFVSSSASRDSSPDSDAAQDSQGSDARDEDERGRARLSGKYPDSSVWRKGQDFFSVVGWAFNCSVLYPNRWRFWKHWLEFMLDLLESDLTERCTLDTERGNKEMPLLRESILASFIGQRSGRSAGGIKWIVKALFADGSKSASSLFREVWQKEHKEMSSNALNKRKREKVNIDKGDFGGWLDNDSVYSSQASASEPPTPQKRRTNSGHLEANDFQALEPAFVESIPMRQRLFSLLSYLCYYLPKPPLDLADLYESLEATTKSLPLPIFAAFLSSMTSSLDQDVQISIFRGILELLMPSNALSPAKVDRVMDSAGGISSAMLERCFLPYPANTITPEDNAKVSLLCEQLMQVIWRDGTESFGEDLRKAVRTGIQARDAKTKKKKTRGRGGIGADDPDAEARAVLDLSGERLLTLVDLIADLSADEAEGEEIEHDDGKGKLDHRAHSLNSRDARLLYMEDPLTRIPDADDTFMTAMDN